MGRKRAIAKQKRWRGTQAGYLAIVTLLVSGIGAAAAMVIWPMQLRDAMNQTMNPSPMDCTSASCIEIPAQLELDMAMGARGAAYGTYRAFETYGAYVANADERALEVPLSNKQQRLPAAKVTLLAVPGWSFLNWEEDALDGMPHLSALIRQSGIGAMNMRGKEKGAEDAYMTWGAGAPASSSADYAACGTDEAVCASRYTRMSGLAPRGQLVVPEIGGLRRRNASRTDPAIPGLLGERLQQAGVATGVFGNSDLSRVQLRSGALTLMDANGRLPWGKVGEATRVEDPTAPGGFRTDPEAVLDGWRTVPSPGVVLLEWGDWLRLQEEGTQYEAAVRERARRDVLERLDELLGRLMRERGPEDALWLLSPTVGKQAAGAKLLLAPVVYSPPNGQGGGLLRSPSTQRSGIVTAADVAPSILAFFGLEKPNDMTGQPIEAVARSTAKTTLLREVHSIREVHRLRPKLLVPFVTAETGVLLASALAIWLRARRLQRMLGPLLLALLAAPLALLAVGWVQAAVPLAGGVQTVIFVGLTAAMAIILPAGRSMLHACGLLAGFTAAGLIADTLIGSPGMKHSVLGYDAIIGARFYGIGNEYMGVLIGAAVLVFALWLARAAPDGRLRGGSARAKVEVKIEAAPRQWRETLWRSSSGESLRKSINGESLQKPVNGESSQEPVNGEPLRKSVNGELSRKFVNGGPVRDTVNGETFWKNVKGEPLRRTGNGEPLQEAAKRESLQRTVKRETLRKTDKGEELRKAAKEKAEAAQLLLPPRRAAHARRQNVLTFVRAWTAAAFLGVLYVLAAPQLGTNAGGAITAAVAFGLVWLMGIGPRGRGGRGWLKLTGAAFLLIAAGFGTLWVLHDGLAATAAAESHIGRAMALLHEGRLDLIAAMMIRKLKMNAHLIGVSVWVKGFTAAFVTMAVALLSPQGLFRRWRQEHMQLMNGFMAIAAGSLVALVFNDSGIVAAATMLVYAAVPMLLLRFQEDSCSHSS